MACDLLSRGSRCLSQIDERDVEVLKDAWLRGSTLQWLEKLDCLLCRPHAELAIEQNGGEPIKRSIRHSANKAELTGTAKRFQLAAAHAVGIAAQRPAERSGKQQFPRNRRRDCSRCAPPCAAAALQANPVQSKKSGNRSIGEIDHLREPFDAFPDNRAHLLGHRRALRRIRQRRR